MRIFGREKTDSCAQYLKMMNQWFILNQRQCTVADYLDKNRIRTAAIYGMGLYGRHLVRDLLRTQITVLYAIDRKKMEPYEGVPVIRLREDMPKVDAVINTVITDHNAVAGKIKQFCSYPVLNLEDIVFSSYEGAG